MAILTPQYLEHKGYTAAADRLVLQSLARADGVVAPTDLIVSAATGMNVSVAAGRSYIAGDYAANQGYYHFQSTSSSSVTLSAANGSNPRIDQIVARIYDSADGGNTSDQATFEVVTGTPTSGATLTNLNGAQALPKNSLRLAYVLVPAGSSTISSGNILDGRKIALVTADQILDADKLGISGSSIIRRGAVPIATPETRTSSSYGLMTTADRVQNVVLPTNGLLVVAYQATWQESVSGAAGAAIFIGSNQLKAAGGGGSPQLQEATTNNDDPSHDHVLASYYLGLVSAANQGAATGYPGDVTTGQVVGVVGDVSDTNHQVIGRAYGLGGPCYIFAAAGAYDISIRFRASSGSVTVKNRRLYVWTIGF